MIYFNNPVSTFNIAILINLLPKRPAPKQPAQKSRTYASTNFAEEYVSSKHFLLPIAVLGGTPVGGNPDGHADMHQVGNGTFQVKFYPVRSSFFRSHGDKEGLVDAQIQCITALNYYKNYSLEVRRTVTALLVSDCKQVYSNM